MAQALLTGEQAQAFELVEQLESLGIQHEIPLPQLIVCGDQSSGKSSLLEAISGLRFPINAKQCTLFATQVVLRRSPTNSSNVTIIPGRDTSAEDRERLQAFRPSSSSIDDLQATVQEAAHAMKQPSTCPLSDNVLKVEITGPDRPHLTLIDLPGLVLSVPDGQSKLQIPMIERLVRQHMQNPRAIILAVISGAHHHMNQRVLEMAKEFDPIGARTIGVVTKPDSISHDDQEDFLGLLSNQVMCLQLGYHVVKNVERASNPTNRVDRDAAESKFFEQRPWTALPPSSKGITCLVKKLSAYLGEHLSRELPAVMNEIHCKLQECNVELEKIGNARSSSLDQRRYLTGIAENFSDRVEKALTGRYNGSPVGERDMQLRAKILDLQDAFSYSMRLYGPRLDIKCEHSESYDLGRGNLTLARDQLSRSLHAQILSYVAPATVTCVFHAKDVANGLMKYNRGLLLPTLTDSSLVWGVFKDLASPWRQLVDTHVDLIFREVSGFVDETFKQLCDEHAHHMLIENFIDPALNEMNKRLVEKKSEMLAPYHNLSCSSWSLGLVEDMLRAHGSLDPQTGEMDLCERANYIAAIRLVHHAYAYYKTAQSTMVDNVAALVIENCLLKDLRQLFKASSVSIMDENQLALLGGEAADAASRRKVNEDLKSKLSEALDKCRRHVRVLQSKTAAASPLANEISEVALTPQKSTSLHPSPYLTPRPRTPEAGNRPRSRAGGIEDLHQNLIDDLTRIGVDDAGPVPSLTPNGSPSPSAPRVETPRGEPQSPLSVGAKQQESRRSSGLFKDRIYVGPTVDDAGEL
jgi:GTP-binding protein EngB required for normal cell division